MGRTLPTYTQYLDAEWSTWNQFRRALSPEDQVAFRALQARAKKHMAAGMAAARAIPFEALMLSLLIEHEREIARLEAKLRELQEKAPWRGDG